VAKQPTVPAGEVALGFHPCLALGFLALQIGASLRIRHPRMIATTCEIKGLERTAVLLVMQGDAPQFVHQLFVGVSRPRAVLALVDDARMFAALPPRLLSSIGQT
jgi:hypothetical protein